MARDVALSLQGHSIDKPNNHNRQAVDIYL